MATITRVKCRPSMPVGYERVHSVKVVTEAVVAGDLLILGVNGWSLSPVTTPDAQHGFAAQDYYAGQTDCSILIDGEMDGWSGMTPGAALYPGAAGILVDVALTGFTGLIHAATATAISFSL
jgi:hypothetical protein